MKTKNKNQTIPSIPQSEEEKNIFLEEHLSRIIRLAGKMTNKNITPNDDEYSISLMAISSAMDTYQEGRGEFWSYASVVLRNRLYDYYRSQKKYQKELSTSNQAFDGVLDDSDSEFLLQREITNDLARKPTSSRCGRNCYFFCPKIGKDFCFTILLVEIILLIFYICKPIN